MKKLWNILVLALAINFVALLAGVGYLYRTKRLDAERARAIRALLLRPPTPPVDPSTTQPAERATTRPALKLEELLAGHAGRPATEQARFLRHTFDSRMAQLDRRQHDLAAVYAPDPTPRLRIEPSMPQTVCGTPVGLGSCASHWTDTGLIENARPARAAWPRQRPGVRRENQP